MATFTESEMVIENVTIRPTREGFDVWVTCYSKDVTGIRLRDYEFNLADQLTAQQVTTLTNFFGVLVTKAKAQLAIT